MFAILSIVAGFAAKFLSFLPKGIIEGLFKHLNDRAVQETNRQGLWAQALTSALEVEVQKARVASEERVALWHDPWYKALIYLIVAPPAVHSAMVFMDSTFDLSIVIHAAPPPFDSWGLSILMTFIGGSSATGAVIGAAKYFNKR